MQRISFDLLAKLILSFPWHCSEDGMTNEKENFPDF